MTDLQFQSPLYHDDDVFDLPELEEEEEFEEHEVGFVRKYVFFSTFRSAIQLTNSASPKKLII